MAFKGLQMITSGITSGLNYLFGGHTSNYYEDREHTEMREDTAYQRAVKDMQAAGLNPLTVGGNPAASSSSSAGQLDNAYRLQVLGSLLDIGNLSAKNRQITNNLIGDILGFFRK